MKYKAFIMPEAENDLKETFLWYEDKRVGLGYDFLLQVDASLRFIERNPEISPSKYKKLKATIKKLWQVEKSNPGSSGIWFCQ